MVYIQAGRGEMNDAKDCGIECAFGSDLVAKIRARILGSNKDELR